jgi:hypothetical protein
MMYSHNKPAPTRGGARQVASDMSEAVSYLIGVALSAGLGDIARKLNDVNLELQCTQLAANEDEQPEQRRAIQH